MPYIQGDLIRLSADFFTGGALTDPTTVKVIWKTPAGVSTTWTYPTNFELVKDAVGQFHADISVTAGGSWYFRWEGTGTAQGANQASFTVTTTNI